jgi:hypothetical protein
MLSALVTLALVTSVADANSESQAARDTVKRAIDAQGGEEQVKKLIQPWRAKVKGTTGLLQLNGEILQQSPSKGRISTTVGVGPASMEVVAVVNGNKSWRRIAGFTSDVTGKELAEMEDGEYRSRRVRFLLPLLQEPGIELSLLPDAVVSDEPARGVRVKSKGHRDVDLYFDRGTGLLVKSESRITPPDKPVIVLEQVSSNYRDFGGVKMATKFTKYENHKLTSVEEIIDLTFVDRIDDREFERPK